MPELPEVQTVLDGVESILLSRTIIGFENYYGQSFSKVPPEFSPSFPARLKEAKRRGKYMIFTLDNGSSLIVHLRMTGKLVYEPKPEAPHRHERARILLENGEALSFIDIRTFGKMHLIPTEDVIKHLPPLGVEPLSKEFNAKYLKEKIKGKKTPIKNLLLDQSIIAGLGNIYVCELLYRSSVAPTRTAKSLKDKEIKSIVKDTVEVLKEALAVGGTSVSDYRNIDDKTGEFQNFLNVYQKKNCPKGHEIENVKLGGRSSFFCPKCQS